MAIRDNISNSGIKIKTGILTGLGKDYTEVSLGFKPVQLAVEIYHTSGTFRTVQIYDSRVSTTEVQKVGQDSSNDTIGIPKAVSSLFSEDGKSFRIKDGYASTWAIFRYTAISQFKD